MFSKVEVTIGRELAAVVVFLYFLARLHTVIAGSLF